MDPASLDQIRVTVNPQHLLAINIMIGLMTLGVSLDLKPGDFRRIFSAPKGLVTGVAAQLLILPAFTFLLARILNLPPSVGLGMILVSSCPGSNLSNTLTYLARGNAALSIVMTAFCTLAAIWMTPLNLSLWGNLSPQTAAILRPIGLHPLETFLSLFMIIGVPLTLGLGLSHLFPNLADAVRKPFRLFSTIAFVALVCFLLLSHGEIFPNAIGPVLFPVIIANALAFVLGYGSGRLLRLDARDLKAVCLEVGIHNPALALILAFSFFEEIGGMAVYSICWGVWQIILGLLLSALFSSSRYRVREGSLSGARAKKAVNP